jgi:hypothetical protein
MEKQFCINDYCVGNIVEANGEIIELDAETFADILLNPESYTVKPVKLGDDYVWKILTFMQESSRNKKCHTLFGEQEMETYNGSGEWESFLLFKMKYDLEIKVEYVHQAQNLWKLVEGEIMDIKVK